MDRLIKPDHQVLDVMFHRNQKCSQSFNLTNLMHTMPVAISLTSSHPSIFSFTQPFSIIPPLKTSSFTVFLNKPCDHPPLSDPTATILVRSSMLPTGKARQDDLRRLFSKPGPHIFRDATITVSFVGPHVAEFLLSPSSKSLEMNFLFAKAISWCDESQLTSLLRVAVENVNMNFISALIEAGADVNIRGLNGESLVSLAVKSGKTDVVRVLIESGCVINDKVDRLLHVAADMSRVDLMEIICLGYADIDLNSMNSKGRTPLHIAAINGRIDAIQFLVSIGSDVDVMDIDKWTPLHYAANEGHHEAVEFLLSHSVFSKHAVTNEGKTAYGLAVERGYSDLYDCLHLGDLLHRAARAGDVGTIRRCLDRGAKVDGRDQNGWTPLHRAAFKGNLESVGVLVGRGARVDAVDGTGCTPLLRAVEGGHLEVAIYLLSHGAKDGLKGLKLGHVESLKNYSCLVSSLHEGE